MATNGIEGIYMETRNYGATAAFWASLGFTSVFETGHALRMEDVARETLPWLDRYLGPVAVK